MSSKTDKAIFAYHFLKSNEGKLVSWAELAKHTGWTEGTVRTYLSKKWHWFCENELSSKAFTVKKFNLSLEQFLGLQTQNYSSNNILNVEQKQYYYDVALSFAGEDREYVDQVAQTLRSLDVQVFYDKFEETNLWGKNLYEHLHEIYSKTAKYCVMFISEHYKNKAWTNKERQAAQARAFADSREYILPARFDETEIPGLPTTVGYIDLRGINPKNFAVKITEKIGKLSEVLIVIQKCREMLGEVYHINLVEGDIVFISKSNLPMFEDGEYVYTFNALTLLGFYRSGLLELESFLGSGYIYSFE